MKAESHLHDYPSVNSQKQERDKREAEEQLRSREMVAIVREMKKEVVQINQQPDSHCWALPAAKKQS